jgi:hypothetical protein
LIDVSKYPDDVEVPWFQGRIKCGKCGRCGRWVDPAELERDARHDDRSRAGEGHLTNSPAEGHLDEAARRQASSVSNPPVAKATATAPDQFPGHHN